MKTWGIGTLVLVVVLGWLASPPAGSQTVVNPGYGESGHWEAPIISDLCKDTQRCAEWHDDTDGRNGPKTLCCVEAFHLPRNSYRDCVVAFRYEGRED